MMSSASVVSPAVASKRLALTLGSVLAAALAGVVLQRILGIERVSAVYFMAVIVAAAAFGVWYGLVGAIAATVAFDFASEGRGLGWSLGDKQDLVNLVLFSAGAWVVSLYIDESRREREALVRLTQGELASEAGPILTRVIEFAFLRWGALGEALQMAAAVVLSLAAAGIGLLLLGVVGPLPVDMIFLAGVVTSGILLGPRYALITAILNVIAYDYLAVAPRFTLALDSLTAGINLVVFLAVGWQVGRFTEQVRYERRAVRRLFDAGGRFSATADESTLRLQIAEAVAGVTGGRHVVVRDEAGSVVAVYGKRPAPGADLGREYVGRLENQGRKLGEVVWKAQTHDDDRPMERTVAVLLDLGAAAIARARISGENAQLEGIAHAEELRRALLASVSHDFRTPLAGILGSVTSLVDLYDQYDETVRRDLLLNIREQAFRLSRYVENLLGMSRVESRSLKPQLRPVPLEVFVFETWESIADGMRAARPEVSVPETLWVMADPLLLRQALSNVLENAVKHTPPDRRVQVTSEDADGLARLSIGDFGPGAPVKDLEQLFKPFFRARNSKAGGVGLGLFIARSFLEAMGGTITAKRRGGDETGMIFEISLPMAEVSS